MPPRDPVVLGSNKWKLVVSSAGSFFSGPKKPVDVYRSLVASLITLHYWEAGGGIHKGGKKFNLVSKVATSSGPGEPVCMGALLLVPPFSSTGQKPALLDFYKFFQI